MTTLLRLVGAAATHTRSMLSDLRIDARRMRANLDAAGDIVLSDAVIAQLAPALGRTRAASVVAEAASRAARAGTTMRAALMDLAPEAASITFPGPQDCLGATAAWIDRALSAHDRTRASAMTPAAPPPATQEGMSR